MNELHCHGPFAYGRGDTLHASGPDIADRENTGKAGFQHERWTGERPGVYARIIERCIQISSRQDEALVVHSEAVL